jgi:hypothetical protein
MLDDLAVLRAAAEAYRAAATAAGVVWPDHADPPVGRPPDLVHRLFDVDRVAEQLTWLQSRGWDSRRLFPNGGWLLPWPTGADARESLDNLSFSVGTPFPWRHQLPLFHFEIILYTFVLAGEHEGEIWRYEFSPDALDAVRAATSLAALFTEWTKGIAAGVVSYSDLHKWLVVDDNGVSSSTDLDLFAFPVSVPLTHHPQLRARQRECGVDMDHIGRGAQRHEELLDAIAIARTSLGM